VAETPQSLRQAAERVARHAGETLRKGKNNPLHVDAAEQHDIKLELDRAIQEQIRKEILKAYPDHGFLGEEGGEMAKPGQYEWVVDPIDGTVNLFYGIPHYAVSDWTDGRWRERFTTPTVTRCFPHMQAAAAPATRGRFMWPNAST
jgi:3'-phosphoadenosine 5'-phosphosulfate (PAPS) 3'-phosphatase